MNSKNNYNFKVGDKVIFRKLLEEEYKKFHIKEYNTKPNKRDYLLYLNIYDNYFDKLGSITEVKYSRGFFPYKIKFNDNSWCSGYADFLIIYDIKTKINFIKELIKK